MPLQPSDQTVDPSTLDLSPLVAAAEEAQAADLTIAPASSMVPATSSSRKRQKAPAKAATLGAPSAGPIVLEQGSVALNLSAPQPSSDLSSRASVNLSLPAGVVKAEAKAAVGKADGNWNAFWHKDTAQVQANLKGPMGTALDVSGANELALNYRSAASLGASDTTTHVVRSENRSGRINLAVPVEGVGVDIGGESISARTEDTSRDKSTTNSAAVRTADHTIYAKANWSPISGVNVEGGAAAKVANISWQDSTARSASYQTVNPHVSVSMKPWQSADLTAKLEQQVEPFDAGAFATYSRAEGGTVVTGFQPDHAWQMQAKLQQQLGPAKLTATYTAGEKGTVTEFAQVGGVQAPASTTLLDRKTVAVAVSVPLSSLGLSRTDLQSEARWQSSRVLDPVTGEVRGASGQTPQTVSVKVSHALPGDKIRFGVSGEYAGSRSAYQISELSTTEQSGTVGAFVTYKPGNYQIDLNLNGLYGGTTRDEYYTGLRGQSKVKGTGIQDNSGPMLKLSLHKPF